MAGAAGGAAVTALLLARWRLVAGGAALLVVAALWLAFRYEHALRRSADADRASAMAEARGHAVQAQLNHAAGAAAVRAESRAVEAAVRSEEIADEIRTAAGAETPLPEPVRSAWFAGLGRLRERDALVAAAPGDRPR